MKNQKQKAKNRKQLTGKPFMKALKKWLKENRAALIVFSIYLVITFVAVIFHENWEDEAQAWLSARDCSPIELVGRMGVEGHFMPWYLILMPFAKLGFPYQTMNIISWLITASAAWLMLKHLPCKFYKRVIFIFMLPMIYLYPVISRCYCLLPLGTILAIMFYKDRFEKPLRYLFAILIIVNVHIYTFGFASVMGIEFLTDWMKRRKDFSKKQNKLILYSVTGIVAAIILTCLPLIGSASGSETSGMEVRTYENPIKQLFVYMPINFFGYLFPVSLQNLAYFATAFIIVWDFFTRKSEFLKIFISIIWQCAICCFVFGIILPQRIAIILFIILFFISCRSRRKKNKKTIEDMYAPSRLLVDFVFVIISVWVEIDTGNIHLALLTLFSTMFILAILCIKKGGFTLKERFYRIGELVSNALLICLALTQVCLGFKNIINEIKLPFTDALATAEFINESISEGSIFLTSQESSIMFTPIIPYLRTQENRFYNIGQESFYTYVVKLGSKDVIHPDNIDWRKYCDFGKKLYYINMSKQYYEDIFDAENEISPAINLKKKGTLKEIFDAFDGISAPNEHYTIYEVEPNICDNPS